MKPHDDENNWAELADALGIDTPATQARKQASAPPAPEPTHEQPPPLPDWAKLTEELPDATEQDGDTLLEQIPETEPPAEESEGEGEKKRRRRRRRRRKPGDPTAAATGDAEGDEETEDVAPGFATDEDAEEEEAEPELVGVGIADEPTPDAVRELISNWNVPSWQEIVSGLYRPGGDR
ncbi:MAG TPA: hypothetical protein VGJ05_18750 [Fimbriiglobus sp.]|jgi:hypothetical protein